MPLLRRQPFVKQKTPPDLKPNDEVFHCPLTNEVFTDYEQFFERIILCNSLVWTCSITGRPGLTYQEALDSEEKALQQLSAFPECLTKPILYLATLTHRSRLADMNDDVFVFAKDRYFISEKVDAHLEGERKSCVVISVVPPDNASSADVHRSPGSDKLLNGPDPAKFRYIVQEKGCEVLYDVDASQVSRKKGLFTREKCKLYLKQHCDAMAGGIWKVKEQFIRRKKLLGMTFVDIFAGPLPNFSVSVAKKRPSVPSESSGFDFLSKKKDKKKDKDGQKRKYTKKSKDVEPEKEKPAPKLEEPSQSKLSAEEKLALMMQMKEEKAAAKQARKEEIKRKMEEEKEKRKEERMKEREIKMKEKREKEEYFKQWSKHRDDLECDDLKDMPMPKPIQTHIPCDLFGDTVMVLEFLQAFGDLFELEDAFPGGLNFEEFSQCLLDRDTNSLLTDLLKFLLTAIFTLQDEEEAELEEEENEDDQDDIKEKDTKEETTELSYKDSMRLATHTAQISHQNFGAPLRKLPVDSFTLTEILRLHFMSSGAKLSNSTSRFRYQQRGGYTSMDDPGLDFSRQEPGIIKRLGAENVFDLPPGDKLKIFNCLINQLLTYMSTRDNIEDSFETLKQVKQDLRQLQWAELRRDKEEAQYFYRKRLEEKNKERELEMERKAQKKKEKEEQLKAEEQKNGFAGGKKPTELDVISINDSEDDQTTKTEEKQPNKVEEKQESEGVQKQESKAKRSSRSKTAEENKATVDRLDVDASEIDWESVTPEEKERHKANYVQQEKDMLSQIMALQHNSAVYPVGRDRVFRRYWLFCAVPGLFVEDQEEYMPYEHFTAVPQTNASNPFLSNSLPLKSESMGVTVEEKSTSSDKENEAMDISSPKMNNNAVSQSGRILNPSAANYNNVHAKTNGVDTPMDIDEKPSQTAASVHDLIDNRNKVRWSYYSSKEELESLIDSLNPRGFREGHLKQCLIDLKPSILNSLEKCPVNMLTIAKDKQAESNAKLVCYQSVKSRNKTTQGAVENDSAQELLELNLREMLLDMEERVFAGALGAIKVKNRVSWRDAIENGGYSKQCDVLLWNGKIDSSLNDGNPSEEESSEDRDTVLPVVQDLAKALLQIEQGVESRFLNPPLGDEVNTKKSKQKGLGQKLDSSSKLSKSKKSAKADDPDSDDDASECSSQTTQTPVERWEDSLMECTSLPQLFLHMSVLEQSIAWGKSALNARCRLCRRKGDGEKMLLCDGCDRGHHMYCLKPQVKQIPKGDWFCPTCKPKKVERSPKKRRPSKAVEESEQEEESEDEEAESEDDESNSDDEEEEDGEEDEEDSDEDEEEDSEEEDDNEEEEEEEPVPQPAKIKILGGKKKAATSQPQSGRSTPNSVRSTGRKSGGGNSSKKSTPHETRTSSKTTPGSSSSKSKTTPRGGTSRSSTPVSRSNTPRDSPVEGRSSRARSRQSYDLNNSYEKPQRTSTGNTSKRKSDFEFEDAMSPTLSKSRGNEQVHMMKLAEDLISDLIKHDDAWPFLKPVNKRDVPDYFDIIKTPMDLSTVRVKINKFDYADVLPLVADVRLIFTNCFTYNLPSAEEYQAGQKLSKFFEKRVKDLKLESSNAKLNGQSPSSGVKKLRR